MEHYLKVDLVKPNAIEMSIIFSYDAFQINIDRVPEALECQVAK